MIQWFNKQMSKKKKGFTLIELIVVIAILGILAAIAIPRFGGFTDKAKLAADEQYAALVGNSAMVLLASGDIKISGTSANDTLTVNASGVVSAIGSGVTGLANAAAVNTEINKLVANEALVKDTDGFTVNLTADGYTISGLN